MTTPHAPLPKTLGDLGDDWRLSFRCLTCGRLSGVAFYYLRLRWGTGMRLREMLPKLRCEQCSAAGRAHECTIVVEPADYHIRQMKKQPNRRFQLRRGHGWSPYPAANDP